MLYEKRVLIAEDSVLLRRLVVSMLQVAGDFVVDEAGDGAEALAALRANRYDLVVSDWNMGGLDGLQLFRAMRDEPALAGIPFILMSGEHTPDTIARAVDAGVFGFLPKPFSRDQLARQVERVLAARVAA
ncbi:response regulator [Magnetospirillum sp. UT-4]|uniref:response regulator n=1 Tax=Magnetospirillum sp. UT-4 TaxID=2681467 RepID=UPI001380CB29|nr:response regulator [Magnetospirillum sp. UT-4]CAA7611313.1 Chemotaxis protein cheY [Magnetospirillum sp. UT-4]